MKQITKLEPQKQNPKRLSVFVDGVFAFGLYEKRAEQLGVVVGRCFSDEEYILLLRSAQLEKAKFTALEYLSRGNKTSKQVRDKLKEKEYSEEIAEEVMDFLEKYRYIDDEAFAKRYVESQVRYNRKSKRRVLYDLYQKGIQSVDLEDIASELEKLEDENIRYYLEKYRYSTELERKQKEKIANRILGKGFSYSAIRKNMDFFGEYIEL